MLGILANWMKGTKDNWRSRYYRKSFIIILFISAIPGIIVGSAIYFIGVKEVENQLQNLHRTQIDTRAQHINEQLDALENALSYWAFEPRFSTDIVDVNFTFDFLETRDIVRTLQTLEGSNPLVRNVELFMDTDRGPVLFRPSFTLVENQELVEWYRGYADSPRYIDWQTESPEGIDSNYYSLMLMHSVPGVSRNPYGALVVHLDVNALMRHLETLAPYEFGATILLNGNGEVLLSSNETELEYFIEDLTIEVARLAEGETSFQYEAGDEVYTVSTGSMARLSDEWTYVSAAPISSITSPILFISQIVLAGSAGIVIIAFIFTWLASRNIFKPIRRLSKKLSDEGHNHAPMNELEIIEERWETLTNERVSLQNKLSEQEPQLRENFLHQLTKGYLYDSTEESLRKRMSNFGWEVEEAVFIVIDLQLTGLYDSTTIDDQDETVAIFSSMNIVQTTADDYFSDITLMNHYDLSLSVFICVSRKEYNHHVVIHFSHDVMEKINDLTEMKVTLTISGITDEVKQIPTLFEDVSHGKRYRKFENKNQLIDLNNEEHNRVQEKRIYYPFETEKEIIQSVRKGDLEDTELLLEKFVNEMTVKGVSEMQILPGMIQLYGKIQHEILHTGIHPEHLFTGRNLLEELQHIREDRQMIDWMMNEVIRPFIRVMEGKLNLETKRNVEEVVLYIHEHYHEDISLESCAEKIGVNPYTLSKSFKKIQGINFIDYLTDLRMDEAKRLLADTNMKINDIAEQVGYRHTYFNRIFKKHYGMPPGQYRKMNRKND
ncbi:AraC family transcriptional regulator [Paenalkalicoccus suaedae]|uniref:AraC family transcriptional regulator n=1 Tax=Paenalkalicoccus suaedae TaxID=2592382 RepID=A0A859F9F5_9BACI|nr:helix-turn-helix domain-containing protein [Paenalkalicoccus suaedae]QKS69753.1 AraC family transcriptional regulator [Paenalkalicoccus suaedae]